MYSASWNSWAAVYDEGFGFRATEPGRADFLLFLVTLGEAERLALGQ
jgi:hypothetical protein